MSKELDIQINVTNRSPDIQIGIIQNTPDIQIGMQATGVTKDYNRLKNKPQINNVTLEGNKYLMDLFPDGILINCGDATGYPEPVIPPEVPTAEGVGF